MFQRLSPLFPYLRRYRRSFLWGGLALLLYNAAKVVIPQLIGRSIDDMQRGLSAAKVEHYALLLFGIAILSGIFLYLMRQIIIGASREIEFDIRNDLFQHLESQPPEFFQRHRTGDIMARSTNDLNAVRQLLGPAIMYSANTLVFTAAALPFMIRISPRLTLIAFLPLPFVSVLVQYFGARIHTRFERIQAMFSDISAMAEENFSGARLIRAFAQEEAQIALFEEANREYIRRSLLLARLMAMLWPTLEFVLGLSLMITLLVGGHEVVTHQIKVGDFTSYFVYMVQLTWPMIAIGWVTNLVQRGAASVTRIHQLMTERPSIDDSAADPTLLAQAQHTLLPTGTSSTPHTPVILTLNEVKGKDPRISRSPDHEQPQAPKHSTFTPSEKNNAVILSEVDRANARSTQSKDPRISRSSNGEQSQPLSHNTVLSEASNAKNSAVIPSEASNAKDNAVILSERSESKDPETARTHTTAEPSPTTKAQPTTLGPGPWALTPVIRGHITFHHLTFAYPTGPAVLHDITLDIPAGSSLAITGPTGSGKSTLISLIPRLYDAPAGTVLIDHRPVRDYPLETLRRAIGFVPQETFLFSDTIRENIAFGVPSATDEEVEEAARIAHIATEILEFPRGFQTIVGERGMTLSGGQKQRTAIARALLRDPRILILDDALASVDTHTEDEILTGLRSAMQGRTTILIAHRVSTARSADRIAVLIDGRIAELGTHDELLALNGYYTELFEKQSLEEELVNA